MRTLITVRPHRPDPDELHTMTARALRAAAELHYHILRSLDAQVDNELRQTIAARRIGALRLRQWLRHRDETQAILAEYLSEICRRARTAKGLTDSQDDDELLGAYEREARATVAILKTRARQIETAPKRVQKIFGQQYK